MTMPAIAVAPAIRKGPLLSHLFRMAIFYLTVVRTPSTNHMYRKPPGGDGDDVEADIQRRQVGPPGDDPFRGAPQPAALAGRYRFQRRVTVPPRFHFNDRQDLSAPRDDIDFADRSAPPAPDDPVAAQDQPRHAQHFSDMSASPCLAAAGPCHLSRASARA